MRSFLEFLGIMVYHYWWAILLFLIVWNLVTFSIYSADKRRALKGHWRISESDLLAAAFMGGAIGALTACAIKRHKTQKKSFADSLFRIAVIQMLSFGGLIGLGFTSGY
jgi:uncharacterized membrane protein YsdA (DUF1294 family)